MKTLGRSLLAVVGLAVAAASTGVPPSRPADSSWWPIPRDYGITSHFGDYRWDGRVHTGLDFSTNLQIGLPVRAWKDGLIVRLRVDPSGYGRALYVKHSDGTTAVYAHLDRFENDRLRLEDRVHSLRGPTHRRFIGDVFLNEPVPVSAGQVIAYTGESGAGRPHLHFEVRDAQETPLNPLDFQVRSLHERQRPVIQGVMLVPARSDTFIDGRPEVRFLEPAPRRAQDTYPETVLVTGPVDVAVAAFAPSVRPYMRMPDRIEVRLDGQAVYVWHPTAVRFDERNLTGFVYALGLPGPPGWAPVLRVTGSARAPRGLVEQGLAGPLDVAPGLHELAVVAENRSGGRVEFRVPIRRTDEPSRARPDSLTEGRAVPRPRLLRPAAWTLGPSVWGWTGADALWTSSGAPTWTWTLQGAVLRAPAVLVRLAAGPDGGLPDGGWVCPNEAECYRQWLWNEVPDVPPALVDRYGPWSSLRVADPARAHEWRLDGLVWEIPAGGLWDPASLIAIPTSVPALPEGLVAQTPVYRLEPADLPFRAPHRLTGLVPPEARGKPIGIFVFHPKRQKWLFAGTMPEAPRTMTLWHPVTVVVAEDRSPPRIRTRTLVWDRHRLPLVRIPVGEVGLGLREDRIVFTWDGMLVTDPEQVYYDPDWEAVVFRPPRLPTPGGHTVTLQVEDWAGLMDRAEVRIHVLP